MVNNSTNINKMNNHFNSLNIEKTMTYEVGNPGLGLGQAQKCGGLKLVNVIPSFSLLIIAYILDLQVFSPVILSLITPLWAS